MEVDYAQFGEVARVEGEKADKLVVEEVVDSYFVEVAVDDIGVVEGSIGCIAAIVGVVEEEECEYEDLVEKVVGEVVEYE